MWSDYGTSHNPHGRLSTNCEFGRTSGLPTTGRFFASVSDSRQRATLRPRKFSGKEVGVTVVSPDERSR